MDEYENTTEEDLLVLKKRIEYFFSNKVPVHKSKKDGWFSNGLILEFNGDLVIINDVVRGAVPVYLIEIKYVEKQNVVKKE